MRREPLTATRLREILLYDPESGLFTYRTPRGPSKAGAVAGSKTHDGYWRITIDGREYKAHRLAWLYVHGQWPRGEVDHRLGQRTDNRIAELRDLTSTGNRQNLRGPTARSSTGFLGVSWHKRFRKFEARIRVNGKGLFLGRFDDPEVAHHAYLEAKRLHHEGNVL